jgi:hypothetical protein
MTGKSQKGGGRYGSNQSDTYKYNSKNKKIEHINYGSCTDKPDYTYEYTYYSDDVTLKERTTISTHSKTFAEYDSHGNITSEFTTGKYYSWEDEYKYEY